MKLFWTISTLAVLAAMMFGSLLHRRGQEFSAVNAESGSNGLASRVPSFVADLPLPVQESEMPFEFPLMPELLPEPKNDLPEVKFVSEASSGKKDTIPRASEAAVKRASGIPVKRHISTVDLSKIEMPNVEPLALKEGSAAAEERPETAPDDAGSNDRRFLPIVLHIGSDDGKLVIQGSIPTREDAEAVYKAVVKVAGEDSVDNHLKYSPETLNADWLASLPEYIETFFSYSAGLQELIVVDDMLKLRGDVVSQNSKDGLVVLAAPLRAGGLEIDTGLAVKESLAGELSELPGSYAALVDTVPAGETEPKEELKLAMLETSEQLSLGEDAQSRSASILADELAIKRDGGGEAESPPVMASAPLVEVESENTPGEPTPAPDFVGPAVAPEEWAEGIAKAKADIAAAEAAISAAGKAAALAAAKAKRDAEAAAAKEKAKMEAAAKLKAEQEAAALAGAEKAKAEKEAADAAAKEKKLKAMLASGKRIPDDGKPLIFYFETGSSEIISSDREKLARAIQRAQVPRSIVYITAYADYRGGYELNRKLSLERAEKVRGLIFAGEVADEVTAEITAKGDSQSVKQDRGKRETDEALRRSRRVVVEVYHLKR